MNAFPVHDWQFWVVTALFLAAVAWLARGIIPRLKGRKGASRRATLTVGGKPVDPVSRIRKP